MRKIKKTNERAVFIDTIQEWFRRRSKFWALISLFTLASLIALQFFLTFIVGINPLIRQGTGSFLIPLLLLFVVSIFWRGSIQTFLSLAGTLSLYVGMFYIYAKTAGLQTLTPIVTNKLGVGKIVESPSISSVANFYFFVGIVALILCVAIAFRPSFFKAKGTRIMPSYPVWTNENDDANFAFGANIMLIPVLGLLSFSERYLVAKYKYIVVMIGGTPYFVSPDDWVPEGSVVIRDKESGSLLGIPKVADGFNVW